MKSKKICKWRKRKKLETLQHIKPGTNARNSNQNTTKQMVSVKPHIAESIV